MPSTTRRRMGPAGDEGDDDDGSDEGTDYTGANQATITKNSRFPWRSPTRTGVHSTNPMSMDMPTTSEDRSRPLSVTSVPGMPRVASFRKMFDPTIEAAGIEALTMDQDVKGRQCPINPDSSFMSVWRVCMLLGLLVAIFQTPILVAWQFATTASKTVSVLVDILFMFDFAIQFFKGYVDDNRNLIMNQKQVVRHYIETWASLDLISCLPWGLFELHRSYPSGLQLFKILRLVSLRHLMTSIKSLNAALLTWVRIGLIFVGYVCLVNGLACIWWYLARSADPSEWPSLAEFPNQEAMSVFMYDKSMFFQYTVCVYYVVVTITTLGYGDIVPRSMKQRWFTNTVLLFTGFLDAFIFGYVVSLVSTFYSFYISNIQKTKAIRQYIDNNTMPKEMEKRIWHYSHHRQHLRARFDASYVFGGFPRHLVKDVVTYAHYEKLALLFGEDVEIDVLRQLAARLQWTYCVTGEQWAEYGRVGNHAFYLQRGTFLINHPGCCVRTLVGPVGAWYGANMLIGPMRRHKVVMEAMEDCDLFVLTRWDFEEVLKDFPAWRETLVNKLKEVHLPLHTIGNLRRSFVDDPARMGFQSSSEEDDDEDRRRNRTMTQANTGYNAGGGRASSDSGGISINMEDNTAGYTAPPRDGGGRPSVVRFDLVSPQPARPTQQNWEIEDSYTRKRRAKNSQRRLSDSEALARDSVESDDRTIEMRRKSVEERPDDQDGAGGSGGGAGGGEGRMGKQ